MTYVISRQLEKWPAPSPPQLNIHFKTTRKTEDLGMHKLIQIVEERVRWRRSLPGPFGTITFTREAVIVAMLETEHPEEQLFGMPRGQIGEREATIPPEASIRCHVLDPLEPTSGFELEYHRIHWTIAGHTRCSSGRFAAWAARRTPHSAPVHPNKIPKNPTKNIFRRDVAARANGFRPVQDDGVPGVAARGGAEQPAAERHGTGGRLPGAGAAEPHARGAHPALQAGAGPVRAARRRLRRAAQSGAVRAGRSANEFFQHERET
ncbi:hypothetical protein ON010_g9458 [Phytophthora cinnamomi]|nr:hypothetical protein ON010_g9458 [Phytophthora cinnamomi]